MVPRLGGVGVNAARAVDAAARADDDGRAFVIGLIFMERCAGARLALAPSGFESGAVALGAVALEELAIGLDAVGDEIAAGLLEDRAAFVAVGVEQRLAAPALKPRRQLPAEIGCILEAAIEAKAAIGRVAVRGIAGDEDAADTILLGDRDR